MTIDRVIRRRILLGFLVAASFGLLTAWYREVDDGPLHRAQGSVADAAVPLSAAVHRVSRPFRDVWDWGRGLANARDEVQRLQAINQRQAVELARQQQELADTTDYRTLLGFTKNPRFSRLLERLHAASAPTSSSGPVEPDAVRVLIDSGQRERRRQGRCRRRRHRPRARGARRHRRARQRQQLRRHPDHEPRLRDRRLGADRARPTASCGRAATRARSSSTTCRSATPCKVNDVVSTSGWQDAEENFESRLPQGIPIGVVTQVNDPGDALVKVIQVTPLVDLDAFSHVLVLTERGTAAP